MHLKLNKNTCIQECSKNKETVYLVRKNYSDDSMNVHLKSIFQLK